MFLVYSMCREDLPRESSNASRWNDGLVINHDAWGGEKNRISKCDLHCARQSTSQPVLPVSQLTLGVTFQSWARRAPQGTLANSTFSKQSRPSHQVAPPFLDLRMNPLSY